ncbi:hypothetical protein GUJ93_ZPchr0010g11050 [Zizania palustris]|uniref:Uncharacterized protein n=1 Tax=Zizania palustris TaxID=103762 RepID=A0A8J5WCR2_ZIZPA|nr:hypothetical protein GUJ93_ZPchr0010g11050 [Zizania palustris]
MRISSHATNLCELVEKFEEVRVVKKMLRVVPEKYNKVAVAIEMLLDLNTMSIEELVGQLRVVEDRYDIKEVMDGVGQFLLTEEQWETRRRQRRDKERAHKDGIKKGGIVKQGGRKDDDEEEDDNSSGVSAWTTGDEGSGVGVGAVDAGMGARRPTALAREPRGRREEDDVTNFWSKRTVVREPNACDAGSRPSAGISHSFEMGSETH